MTDKPDNRIVLKDVERVEFTGFTPTEDLDTVNANIIFHMKVPQSIVLPKDIFVGMSEEEIKTMITEILAELDKK